VAQDERRGFEIVHDFPFMLRVSKHSELFFGNLLGDNEPKFQQHDAWATFFRV